MPQPLSESTNAALLVTTSADAPAMLAAMDADPRAPQPVALLLLDNDIAHIDSTLPLLETFEQALQAQRKLGYSEVLLSLPASHNQAAREIASQCRHAGLNVKHCPTPSQLWADNPPQHQPLDTQALASLVGRSPHHTDPQRLGDVIAGKRILITGAGGSIGSEIARIAATHSPAALVLLDRSENALFELDRELSSRFQSKSHRVHLQDVVDEAGTMRAFAHHQPDVVFHAAAHKHVPMMEDHPGQAVTNNLFGTASVLDASMRTNVQQFVLISTDKAVQPTSVMGATKRLAELLVLSRQPKSATRCSIVRFGNVLGSACSVLPIWARQLHEGSAITLTDERMTRYFMTIPEAASLVIQSASLADGDAHVFVLDMGQPVRILDLAQRFIAHQGLSARIIEGDSDLDIPGTVGIRITGARPGEKLHEELSYSVESLQKTPISGIQAWKSPISSDWDANLMLTELDRARRSSADADVQQTLAKWVPGYRTQPTISVSERVLNRAG